MEELFSRLYTSRYRSQLERDQIVDFIEEASNQNGNYPIVLSNQIAPEEEEQSEQRFDEQDIQQMRNYQQIDKITVYGQPVAFRDGKFRQADFYQQVIGHTEIKCYKCPSKIKTGELRNKCIFCAADFHVSCTGMICECTYPRLLQRTTPTIPLFQKSNKDKSQKQRITMPQLYMRKNTQQQEQIRILLTLRRFRYTRIPQFNDAELRFPDRYWENAEQLILPSYQRYIKGQYMPTIQALPAINHAPDPVFGVSFGIYATQSIEKDIFIGEYACDLLKGNDLSLCKKNDSIMMLSGNGTPQDVFLAPKDHAGYVLLLNTGNFEEENNCACLRVVISSVLRIIIVTKRRIEKGEELLYSYGSSYRFRIKVINLPDD